MSKETSPTIADAVNRATLDREFRERLLKNPKETLAEISGEPLPEEVTIRFIEKDPDVDALIVLPDLVPDGHDLTPEELESVAGGAGLQECFLDTCCVSKCEDTCIQTESEV